MKYKELTTKPETELRKMLTDLQHEAHDLAVKIRMSEEKKTHKLKVLKKDIARILTFLSNKK
jgi:ribosomal protein L29